MSDGDATQSWHPPESTTCFRGQPLPENKDFFAPPPSEIGRVLLAETTLIMGRKPKGSLRILAESVLYAAAIGGLLTLLAMTGREPNPVGAFLCITTVFAPIILIFLYCFSRFQHECSYVGDAGIATFELSGHRSASPRMRVLLFAKADESFSKHSIGNDRHREIEWRTAGGDRLFHTVTTHSSWDFTKRSSHRLRFIDAAEAVWSQVVLSMLKRQWETESQVNFRFRDRKRVLTLEPGVLKIGGTGDAVEIPVTDISSVKLHRGLFRITEHETSFVTGKGHHAFRYDEVGNACVLLEAIGEFFYDRRPHSA